MWAGVALTVGLAWCLDASHTADVGFFDDAGNFQSYQLSYFIAPDQVDTGVTFAVEVYNVTLADCLPQLDTLDDEYFATYVLVPPECAVGDVVDELESHGADFIFIDAGPGGVGPVDAFDKYDEPVFFLDAAVATNIFQFSNTTTRRVVSIRLREDAAEQGLVQLQLFYDAGYPELSTYLTAVSDVLERLGDRVAFEPMLMTFSSTANETIAQHCVANGAYCAAPPASRLGVSGKAMLAESIRQLCIGRISSRAYFQYMALLLRACSATFSAECSASTMQRVGLTFSQVQACVEESFTPGDEATRNNTALLAHRQRAKTLGLRKFPAIAVDGEVYRGTLSKFDLLLSLCSALGDNSDDCRDLGLEAGSDLDLPAVLVVALLFFGLAVTVMAWLCRKVARERYMTVLNAAIAKHVAEYADAEDAANMQL